MVSLVDGHTCKMNVDFCWAFFQPLISSEKCDQVDGYFGLSHGTDIYAVGGQLGSCSVMQVGICSLFPRNHYICSFHMCIHCSWHALCSDYFYFNVLHFLSFKHTMS